MSAALLEEVAEHLVLLRKMYGEAPEDWSIAGRLLAKCQAALLAQSAAYEALVAGCSELAAKLDRQAAENYTDRGNALSRCADDIRLLVSDDRPSHDAGDGNG